MTLLILLLIPTLLIPETMLELLDPFATHLYQDIAKRTQEASGEERADLEARLQRIKLIIAGLAKAGPDIW